MREKNKYKRLVMKMNKTELDALVEDIRTNKLVKVSAKTKKAITEILKNRLDEVNQQIAEAEQKQTKNEDEYYELSSLTWVERHRKSVNDGEIFQWTEHWLIHGSGEVLAVVSNPLKEDPDGPYTSEIKNSNLNDVHFYGESDAKKWCEEILTGKLSDVYVCNSVDEG